MGLKSETTSEVLAMLRDELAGELWAINQYQVHIDAIDDPEVRRVLEHIQADEREHVAELMGLILRLDKAQAEKFEKEGL